MRQTFAIFSFSIRKFGTNLLFEREHYNVSNWFSCRIKEWQPGASACKTDVTPDTNIPHVLVLFWLATTLLSFQSSWIPDSNHHWHLIRLMLDLFLCDQIFVSSGLLWRTNVADKREVVRYELMPVIDSSLKTAFPA